VNEAVTVVKIAARLAWNGLHFRLLRAAGRPGTPQAVSLEVTHRCICRCVMCNIWNLPASVPELPLEAWVALLQSEALRDLRELDITGGEPFLRDDLVDLIGIVCSLKSTHLTKLRSIVITTNGVMTDRVLRMTEEMLDPVRRSGLELVLVCGLDAVGPTHDEIRRHKGAWSHLDLTLNGLTALRSRHPELIVGLKTTVLPQNLDQLERISDYARQRALFTIISPAIATSGRYLNSGKESDLALPLAGRERLARFCEGPDLQWSHHARALARYLRTGRMRKPCTCGFNYFFVRSDGRVHLCPLFEESVGVIGSDNISALLDSSPAHQARVRVGRSPECARCTEPGLERYSLPYEGFTYLRMLFQEGPRRFLRQHRHLGLDKYL